MARTKASGGGGAYRKVLAGRAPRKVQGSGRLNAARLPPRPVRRIGRNSLCVRPLPAWQKGIGDFLRPQQKEDCDPDGEAAGSSGQGKKRRAHPLPPDPAEDDSSCEEQQE